MHRPLIATALTLSLASPTFAQGKSKKDIPPPIEVTGTNRRLTVISPSPTNGLLPNDLLLQYDTPDRQDQPSAKPVPSRLRIFIPGNHKTIKAVVFDLGYTYTPDSTPLQAVAREEGWAVIGCLLRYKYGTEILNTALKEFAEKSRHAELLTAPIIPMGFSRNGSRAWDFAEENPDRTLALGLGGNPGIPSGMLTREGAAVPARIALAQSFPALTVAGSRDPFVDYDKGEARFWHNAHYPRIRAQEGVTWGMMIGWGYGHGWEGSWTPFVTFFQDCVALRGDAAPLKKINFEDGWFAEYGWKTDWPEIAPVKEFKGDKTKAIWLPAANTAHVWRAFQVQKPKVTLTVEAAGGALKLKASAPEAATSVEFFDRAASLGTASAAPFELKTDKLATGTRTIFAVATTPDGKTPSRPITVAGGKALDWKQGDADQKRADQPLNIARLTPQSRSTAEMLTLIKAGGPSTLPGVTPEEVATLRKELEALAKDPFVEQRDAAGKLSKLLPQ